MAKFEKGNKFGNRFNSETAKEAKKKSHASHIQNKHGRELLLALLDRKCDFEDVRAKLHELGLKDKDITNEVAMHLRQIERAIRRGDTAAYEKILRAAGQLTDKSEVDMNVSGAVAFAPMTAEELKAYREKFDEEF